MFDDVPEPVWKTSMGNWSSCSPFATARPASAIRWAMSESSSPSSALTSAAAAFIRPRAWTTAAGTVSPEIGKFSTALLVSPPQSCSVICPPSNSWTPSRLNLRSWSQAGAGSAALLSGLHALLVGGVELAWEGLAARAEHRCGLDPLDEIGVDSACVLRPLFHRAHQITELDRSLALRRPTGARVQLRRGPHEDAAEAGQLAGRLVLDQAGAD